MTELASELDQKLAQLAPAKARVLERLVREAIALADAGDSPMQPGAVEREDPDLLELQVHPLPLTTSDFERLAEALEQPLRDLPRLRELLNQSGKFGNA